MSAAEIAMFEREPYHLQAVRVRRCDDEGKVAGLLVPSLRDYQPLLDRLAVHA
jgi:predicted HD phosphohydrolase